MKWLPDEWVQKCAYSSCQIFLRPTSDSTRRLKLLPHINFRWGPSDWLFFVTTSLAISQFFRRQSVLEIQSWCALCCVTVTTRGPPRDWRASLYCWNDCAKWVFTQTHAKKQNKTKQLNNCTSKEALKQWCYHLNKRWVVFLNFTSLFSDGIFLAFFKTHG